VKRKVIVAALGTTQTLAWGSSYYLPAILAEPIAEGLGLSRAMVFGIFSGSLLLSAFLGPAVGRAIDNRGGRGVLVLSNIVLVGGLVWLALAQGVIGLAAAWGVLGVGMALGLYDSAFATLAGLYGRAARAPITGITLIAGFASTIGWPLSAFLDASMGWRGTCLTWAALNLLVCLPLNRFLIPRAPPPEHAPEPEGVQRRHPAQPCRFWLCVRCDLVRHRGPRTCRACSKLPVRARRPQSQPPRSSALLKSLRGWWSSGPCA